MNLKLVERVLYDKKAISGEDVSSLIKAINSEFELLKAETERKTVARIALYAATFGDGGSGDTQNPDKRRHEEVVRFLIDKSAVVYPEPNPISQNHGG